MDDDLLDSKSKEVREVYARFGLAIYASQCLEHGIVNALILLKLMPTRAAISTDWESKIDAFANEHYEHTLGRLIFELKKVSSVPPALEESLVNTLKKRNWLAHSYFRERAGDFLFTEGRSNMITELDEATEQFRIADELLTEILEPLLKKYGITEELLAKTEEEMYGAVSEQCKKPL